MSQSMPCRLMRGTSILAACVLSLGAVAAAAQQSDAKDQTQPQQGAESEKTASGETQSPGGRSQESGQAPSPQLKLRVFRLEHCQPFQIEELWEIKRELTRSRDEGRPGQVTTRAYRGTGDSERVQEEPLHMASDETQNVIFVRGSEQQVAEFAKLVDSFDVEKQTFRDQRLGDAHLIPVSSSMANRIRTILNLLQFDARLVPWGDTQLIIVRASDGPRDQEELRQLQEVLATLQGDGDQDGEGDQDQNEEQGAQPEKGEPEKGTADEPRNQDS